MKLFRNLFIIAAVTFLIEALLFFIPLMLGKIEISPLIWMIGWGAWGIYCYAKWQQEKRENI